MDEDDGQTESQTHSSQVQELLGAFTNLVLNTESNPIASTSGYWTKCMMSLQELEAGLQKVADRIQRASVVGQTLSKDEEQIMEYEKDTLNFQHESLSAIIVFLIRQGRISAPDQFRQVLNRAKTLDKHDLVMLHYIPIIMSCCIQYGSSIGTCSEPETKAMHDSIIDQGDTDRWGLRNLCRAVRAWWIAEYKERYPDKEDTDDAVTSPENKIMLDSLKDGGLQFMLSVAQDVRRSDWHDPAKLNLTTFLLKGTTVLPSDIPKPAPHFQELMMEGVQSFIDAFISNMPDTLRLLKLEEDDQRKLLRSRYQNNTADYSYDLDRFLTIIAYAYQDSPESAKGFWADTEGNLYGFLQWAAKRQTTPRAAAFCEMLRSISEGEQCAESAHQFLLEEGTPVAGKLRRTASLSWNQIFAELEFYASQTKDRQTTLMTQGDPHFEPGQQTVEPESSIMLECYLRLISHLCGGSAKIRNWLLNNENQPLPHLLFQLMSASSDARVRAWCLTTLSSLLTEKSASVNDAMWEKLDQWISTGFPISQGQTRTAVVSNAPRSERHVLELLATGFEEPNGFVQLLNALVVPTLSEQELNDQLSFPESLGSPYRLPGISLYVDFVLGKVFAEKTAQLTDTHHLNLMRLNCLDFICNTLASFNEDLVIIANLSNFAVESSMRASSLETYVLLHPFSRVMEWLHEDKCLDALFAAAQQDVELVNQAWSDSPLILSLVRAIEAMNLVVKLQPMYFDVVRPFLRRRDTIDKPVSRSPVPSFEDAVLKRLDLIVNLGLYCGLGHSRLTLCSLALLEKLSSSRKLSAPPSQVAGNRNDRNKLITILEKDHEILRISRSLTAAMTLDPREFEAGDLASGYNIKSGIISFLKNTLSSTPDRPNVAHLMLGFSCKGNDLSIEDYDAFQTGNCLFFAIGRLAIEYPDFDGNTFMAWASNIKEACIEILRISWRTPLSSPIVMSQLRESDYAFLQSIKQRIIGSQTLWNGLTIDDPAFMMNDSALALRNFLRQRTAFFDYFARELRHAKACSASSRINRLQSSLLGSTLMPGEPPVPNPNIFELFDFMELDFTACPPFAHSEYFNESHFAVCITEQSEHGPVYDLSRSQEIIYLRQNTFTRSRPQNITSKELAKQDEQEKNTFQNAAEDAILSLVARNQWRELAIAHSETLRLWVRLMVVVVESCDLDDSIRTAFIHQAYQLLVPKFEKAVSSDIATSFELASLLLVLLNASSANAAKLEASQNISTNGASPNGPSRSANKLNHMDGVNDVEYQVFRSALNAATSNTTTVEFRELCYQICCQYLRTASQAAPSGSIRRRNILRGIKLVSDRLIDIVCDDAYTSHNRSGIGALLLLEALVSITSTDAPRLILDGLDRLNFVAILVDSIKQIPVDLRQAQPAGKFDKIAHPLFHADIYTEIPLVLGYHNACLALLLRLAQSRGGSISVFNAGLFVAVRESEIFSADPDVGLGKCC
jgi:nuclear pore complex protein Nup205